MIQLEQETIVLSTETINKLFDMNWWADLVALYLFYHKQAKRQKSNSTFTTNSFIKKWLWRGDLRVKNAKKTLQDLWLIENIKRRDEFWKITWHYVKICYMKSGLSSTGAETHSMDGTTYGWQGTNAWSSYKLNAWSSYKENAILLGKDFEKFIEHRNNIWKIDKNWKKVRKKEVVFDDFEKAYKKFWREEIKIATNKYIDDTRSRKKETSYADHRFTVSEFLTQKNWIKKFINY